MISQDAVTAIARVFAAGGVDEPLGAGGVTREALRAWLAQQLARLLDRSPALLMSLLYRIDVAERDVTSVFTACSPPEVPDRLADLIIDRQLQKLALRRRYGEAGE